MNGYTLEPPNDHAIEALKEFLNPKWIERQRLEPASRRHVVVHWMNELEAHPARLAEAVGFEQRLTGPASGDLQELLALAHDVEMLQRIAPIPSRVRKRLLDRRGYQGARYEITAAAIIARCTLSITWHPQTRGGPEFWADLPGVIAPFAVEAKSRHRKGVLHEEGPRSDEYLVRVARLLKAAAEKEVGDRPLLVFIDINLEDRAEVDGKPAWFAQVAELTAKYDDPQNAPSFGLVVFTNFAWHFAGQEAVSSSPPADLYRPRASTRPVSPALRDLIWLALHGYGAPVGAKPPKVVATQAADANPPASGRPRGEQ